MVKLLMNIVILVGPTLVSSMVLLTQPLHPVCVTTWFIIPSRQHIACVHMLYVAYCDKCGC